MTRVIRRKKGRTSITTCPTDNGVSAPDGRGHLSWTDSNPDALAHILAMYADPGARVADVTFGKGAFWKGNHGARVNLTASDLVSDGIDATNLPYPDASFDMVVFDPPYRYVETRSTPSHTDAQYRLSETLREVRPGLDGVLDLYRDGITEAARVLRWGGVAVVKCQDTVADGRQRWVHVEVMQWCEAAGMPVVDLSVVVTATPPPTRWKHQRTLRKAHSYFIVARKGGPYPHGYKAIAKRDS